VTERILSGRVARPVVDIKERDVIFPQGDRVRVVDSCARADVYVVVAGEGRGHEVGVDIVSPTHVDGDVRVDERIGRASEVVGDVGLVGGPRDWESDAVRGVGECRERIESVVGPGRARGASGHGASE